MPTALGVLLDHWEKNRASPGPGAGSDTRTVSARASPDMAEDLGRLAKELWISRAQLVTLIVHDGHAKVCRTLERIGRQHGATADAAAASGEAGRP